MSDTKIISVRADKIALARCLDYSINYKGKKPLSKSSLVNDIIKTLASLIETQTNALYTPIPFPNAKIAELYLEGQLGNSTGINPEALTLPNERETNPLKLLKDLERGE